MYRCTAISVVRRVLTGAICLVLAFSPLAALAQSETEQQNTPPTAPGETLDSARRLIVSNRYDEAIVALKELLGQIEQDVTTRQQAHLLLIMGYVLQASDQENNKEIPASKRNLLDAREGVRKCLEAPGLRHTTPEMAANFPASDIPPKMIQMFKEVRSEIFGTFEVSEISPPHAMVILGGDTLTVLPNKTTLGDTDIPAGRYVLVVQANGYQTQTDDLDIVPGVNLVRPYTLKKDKGKGWWATRVGVTAAVLVGIGLLIPDEDPPEPLPGPPDPPTGQ